MPVRNALTPMTVLTTAQGRRHREKVGTRTHHFEIREGRRYPPDSRMKWPISGVFFDFYGI